MAAVGGIGFVHGPGMSGGSDDDCSFEVGHNDSGFLVLGVAGKLREKEFRFSSYQAIRFGFKTVNRAVDFGRSFSEGVKGNSLAREDWVSRGSRAAGRFLSGRRARNRSLFFGPLLNPSMQYATQKP